MRGDLGLRGCEVAAFGRVALEVVELGSRGPDVLETRRAQPQERAPAVVEAGRQRLHVGHPLARLRAIDEGPQVSPRDVRKRVGAGEGEEGGRHVDEADRGRHHAPARHPGTAHQQGNALGGVVDRVRVRRLAVLAEALAVIARDDQERASVGPTPAKLARRRRPSCASAKAISPA